MGSSGWRSCQQRREAHSPSRPQGQGRQRRPPSRSAGTVLLFQPILGIGLVREVVGSCLASFHQFQGGAKSGEGGLDMGD